MGSIQETDSQSDSTPTLIPSTTTEGTIDAVKQYVHNDKAFEEKRVQEKLSHRLADHIRHVSISPLSRVPVARLANTALPHISIIELVSGPDFASCYDALYTASFPIRAEREASQLIVDRLIEEFANKRIDMAPYRIVGIKDHMGKAIGAAQFCLLDLPGDGHFAVPYLQYLYVRPENRRQDMAELLHTLVLAVSAADAVKNAGRTVPFTLFETEPPAYGSTEEARLRSKQRIRIHAKSGAVGLMLRNRKDGTLSSSHVQPGLEGDDPPLTLVWAIRPSPAYILTNAGREQETSENGTVVLPGEVMNGTDAAPKKLGYDIDGIGKPLLKAFYQSMRDDGFPAENVRRAEDIATNRCLGCEFVLVPLEDISPLVAKLF